MQKVKVTNIRDGGSIFKDDIFKKDPKMDGKTMLLSACKAIHNEV
jgi:hypothetical protein